MVFSRKFQRPRIAEVQEVYLEFLRRFADAKAQKKGNQSRFGFWSRYFKHSRYFASLSTTFFALGDCEMDLPNPKTLALSQSTLTFILMMMMMMMMMPLHSISFQ